MTHTCKHCGLVKPIKDFVKNKAVKKGFVSVCKACKKSKYKASDKAKYNSWARQLKRNYNITSDDYNRMFEEQNGVCSGCKKPNPSGTKFCVDHDHQTGQVRGLLCGPCNRALGLVKDEISTLLNLVNYLHHAKSFL